MIEIKIQPKAIIIGNGFDLNCGYKTSYLDFIESDFFRSIEMNNSICLHLKSKVKTSRWIDVENELKEIYKADVQFSIDVCETRKLEFIELSSALNKYINFIDNNQKNTNPNAYYLRLFREKYNLFNDSYIICFNYTQTINKLIKQYNSNCELIMLHGEANKDSIILGIEDAINLKKEYDFYYKTSNPNYNCGDVLKRLKQINEFVFMGHSFGETDHYFFSKIFGKSCIENTYDNYKFTIYHYGVDDKRRIISELRQIIGKKGNLMDFWGYNKVEFIDVKTH